jgi:hypothetical protein
VEQEDKNSAKQLEQTFFSSSNNELYIVVRTASARILKLEKWKPQLSLFQSDKAYICVGGLAKREAAVLNWDSFCKASMHFCMKVGQF